MSVVAIMVGGLMLWRHALLEAVWRRLSLPDAKRLFEAAVDQTVRAARRISDTVHNGSLQRQLALMFMLAVAIAIEAMFFGGYASGTRQLLPAPPVAIVAWVLLLAATAAVALMPRQRFLTLIYISVVGLVVSLAFIYLSAPDLALTQISVEVVTILLLLLALNLLPKQPDFEQRRTGAQPLACACRRVCDWPCGLGGDDARAQRSDLLLSLGP